ncbi:SDR family NAD(P)-dependent oxidoreductase [Aestuariibius sp. 2305UL40-4]|uniref:SDR family NAD(P)-dependent oxidoreductase n=1 Tax=Aestuariibius violaceus TaxID=3234132 RepID=UPI00345ECC3E
MHLDFTNRHLVVTGAGGGMGQEIALCYLQAGGLVTGFDVKPPPDALAAYGDRVSFYQVDITDAANVSEAIDAAATNRGRLDHLANVAGVLWFDRDGSALEMDLGVWDEVFDINLKAMVHTARAAIRHMRATEGDRAMVHVSTTQWYRGDPKPQDAYAASKAGVCALSKSLAMQLAAEGIRSNALVPGLTLSPLQARWDDEAKRASAAAVAPLGRLGTPADMAAATLFLLSDRASYITGVELVVDGGLLMR